jgi:hypothetical protein
MPATSMSHVLRHLRVLSEAQATRDLSDGELLERFRVRREETAFALLVQRHGPMVLGVLGQTISRRWTAVPKKTTARGRSSFGT